MELVETESEWLIRLESAVVSLIGIDFRVTFTILDEMEGMNVIIESPFSLSGASGQPLIIDPEATEELATILRLFNREVRSISAGKTGNLRVTFADGTVIRVEPDKLYEAWQVNLPTDKLIGGPGERVEHFQFS